MTEGLTKFRMGADIPEWCLGVEAIDETSVRGAARFGCDVDLIETESYYLICPSNILLPVAGILDFAGSYNCMAIATSKPVRIVQGEVVPFPRGMAPPGSNLPPYGLCIQPVQQRLLAPQAQEWGDRINITRELSPLEKAMWATQERDVGRMLDPAAFPVPDPHRGFWTRLLYVLRGR